MHDAFKGLTVMSGTQAGFSVRRDWRAIAAATLWCCVSVVAFVFVARKLAGAFDGPVSSVAACLTGTLAAMLSLLAHGLFVSSGLKSMPRKVRVATGVVTLLPPLGLAAALLPHQATGSVFYLAGLFICAGFVCLKTGDRHKFGALLRSRSGDPLSAANVEKTRLKSLAGDPVAENSPGGNDVIQRIHRTISPLGQERIEGTMVVFFEKGQKQSMIHLPFVPPLSGRPSVSCDVLSGGEARLRKASVQPFGARIEVKRSQSIDERQWIEVGFTVSAKKNHADAA